MRTGLTDSARADIRRIRERREEYSEASAHALGLALLARLRQIRDMPRSGRMIPEFQHENLREMLEQGYRILYEILPDSIEIFGIVSSRQDIRPPR